jgi:hypothetical protein
MLTLALMAALGGLMTIAYAAEEAPALRWPVLIVLALADLIVMLVGATFTALLVTGIAVESRSGADPALFAGSGPVLLAMGALGMLLLFEPFRRPLAVFTRIDPARLVHVVALHFALALVIVATVLGAVAAAGVAGDQSVLAILEEQTQIVRLELPGTGLGYDVPRIVISAWVQMAGFVIIALLGVGLFIRRNLRESLERLGLEPRVDLRWALGVPAVGLASGWLVDELWRRLSPSTLEGVSGFAETLFQGFIDARWLGVVTVAMTAGIGEELLFRGAAQPRFGLALTALMFAVLHTQYTVSFALLQVFAIGILLGLARIRANTTTAIVAHALYNGVLVTIAVYGPQT